MYYRKSFAISLLGTLPLLLGCANASAGANSQAQSRPDLTKFPVDQGPVMRAAHAILMGQQAEQKADASALHTAAQVLQSLGAKPDMDQEDDLSSRWASQAKSIEPATEPSVYRGRALGPSYKKGMVSALSTVNIEQIFLAGKKASVALVPVSSKPMSIRISDGQGKNICNRSTSSKPANCEWLPLFTERYRINIHTSASQPVTYYLVSN